MTLFLEIAAQRVAPLNIAYHGAIGREATAPMHSEFAGITAYHGEIGSEATAQVRQYPGRAHAYHAEIGREATA